MDITETTNPDWAARGACPRCGGATDPDWYCSEGFCPACCMRDDCGGDDLAQLAATTIVTGRYQTWRPEHGVPVRTTVGAPRFWSGPELEFARLLAPVGIHGQDLPPDAARTAYLARLDVQADQVVAELAGIAARHPGQPLVLLCFEDVHAGQVCHRRWLAEWLEVWFDLDASELAADELPQLRLW